MSETTPAEMLVSAMVPLLMDPRTRPQIRKYFHQRFSNKALVHREFSQISALCLLPAVLSFLLWKASCAQARLYFDHDHLAAYILHLVLCCLLRRHHLGQAEI